MLQYKGFNVPETKEEMADCRRMTPIPHSLPAVVLHSSDKNDPLRITTRITIEDLEKITEINVIVDEFKKIIDAFRRSDNG